MASESTPKPILSPEPAPNAKVIPGPQAAAITLPPCLYHFQATIIQASADELLERIHHRGVLGLHPRSTVEVWSSVSR